MSTEVCKCGTQTQLTDCTLRIGARVVGCKACNWSGIKPVNDSTKGTK